MNRKLDALSTQFKPLAIEFLARCVEAGISVMIVETLRTMDDQLAYIKAGTSWTLHSKHLTGDAIDICPYDLYQLNGPDKLKWDAAAPVWQSLGAIGESLGLQWGGRWAHRDMGHFERKS